MMKLENLEKRIDTLLSTTKLGFCEMSTLLKLKMQYEEKGVTMIKNELQQQKTNLNLSDDLARGKFLIHLKAAMLVLKEDKSIINAVEPLANGVKLAKDIFKFNLFESGVTLFDHKKENHRDVLSDIDSHVQFCEKAANPQSINSCIIL